MIRTAFSALVAFALFVSSSPVSAADAISPQVETALALKKQVDEANQKDLVALHRDLHSKFAGWDQEDGHIFLVRLEQRLASDTKVYRQIRAAILKDPALVKGSTFELRTSLVKLIGIEDAKGAVSQTGLLPDAITMLALPADKNPLFASPANLKLTRNQISVAKTLLVYANVVASGENDVSKLADAGVEKKVQMLYRTPLPKGLDAKLLSEPLLACKMEALLIPNAGYVYGGNFVNGACRGVDCSSFVSTCVQSRVRMSTMYLDFLWREMEQGEKAFTKDELVVREELIKEWKLLESKKDFVAVGEKEELQAGDLVTWRPGGHTVMYLSPVPQKPNEFVAIEANRADDKTKEGIEVNTFERARAGQRTTVLRRVWPK